MYSLFLMDIYEEYEVKEFNLRTVVNFDMELRTPQINLLQDSKMILDNDPIVIVGMGMRAPDSPDVEAFWSHLEQKHDLTRDIPKDRFNTDFWCTKEKIKGCSVFFISSFINIQVSSRCGIIENITEFDAPFFNLSVNEAKELDPQIRLLLETAWYAIEDAGIVLGQSTDHGGVFIGHMTHVFNFMDS